MSGHSKWHNIKIRKSKMDAQRGRVFSQITREIIVAARQGGGNEATNARLKKAIQKAREVNMPQDNIKKAIQRGTGELPGVTYEEYTYEGYGPGGTAIMLEVMTDNRQRTVADIRHIFSRNNANLGESGCVSWMFKKRGLVIIEKETIDEDTIITYALEAGADDVKSLDSTYEVETSPENLEKVKKFLTENKVNLSSAEITMVPQSTVKLEGKSATQVLKLMEALEEQDDIQNIYANFDIPDEAIEEVSAK